MKLKQIVVPIIISAFSIISCKKNKDKVAETTKPSVYVAGFERASGSSNHVAKYWKDGIVHVLSDSAHDAEATCMFISGNDIYIGGYEDNGTRNVAKYWKNGVATQVGNGVTSSSYVNSIFVSGNDVYVLGTENGVPTYWRNGVATTVVNSVYEAGANTIFVSGNDVYVGGYERNLGGYYVAKFWKNGVETILSSTSSYATVYAITVIGNDVHAAGYEYSDISSNDVAKYWKVTNGGSPQSTSLSNGTSDAYAEGIAVSGTDVYIAGLEENTNMGKAWKNGVETTLNTGGTRTYANSVFVNNNDSYQAGAGYSGTTWMATYWKNGVAVNLTNGTRLAVAKAIFVK